MKVMSSLAMIVFFLSCVPQGRATDSTEFVVAQIVEVPNDSIETFLIEHSWGDIKQPSTELTALVGRMDSSELSFARYIDDPMYSYLEYVWVSDPYFLKCYTINDSTWSDIKGLYAWSATTLRDSIEVFHGEDLLLKRNDYRNSVRSFIDSVLPIINAHKGLTVTVTRRGVDVLRILGHNTPESYTAERFRESFKTKWGYGGVPESSVKQGMIYFKYYYHDEIAFVIPVFAGNDILCMITIDFFIKSK